MVIFLNVVPDVCVFGRLEPTTVWSLRPTDTLLSLTTPDTVSQFFKFYDTKRIT